MNLSRFDKNKKVTVTELFDYLAEEVDGIRIEIDFNCKTKSNSFKFLDSDGDFLFHPENYEDVYLKSILLRRILLINVQRLEQALNQATNGKWKEHKDE